MLECDFPHFLRCRLTSNCCAMFIANCKNQRQKNHCEQLLQKAIAATTCEHSRYHHPPQIAQLPLERMVLQNKKGRRPNRCEVAKPPPAPCCIAPVSAIEHVSSIIDSQHTSHKVNCLRQLSHAARFGHFVYSSIRQSPFCPRPGPRPAAPLRVSRRRRHLCFWRSTPSPTCPTTAARRRRRIW